MSIHPEWCLHIFSNRDKIYEVRKRVPKLEPPYKVYVYCTLKEPKILRYCDGEFKRIVNGFVMGEFTCERVLKVNSPFKGKEVGTCLTTRDLVSYAEGKDLYFLRIQNPITYTTPKALEEFEVARPPQSFQFVEVLKNG